MTSKNKKLLNFTIDKGIANIFVLLSKQKCINKSLLIQSFIKKWIEENGNKKETKHEGKKQSVL
jgi:hypothetical protein